MTAANAVAAVLVVGVTMYAVFGGADFGAGLWSLLAGGGEGGRRPRELIDWAIGPVWEANHVWLIFVLVVLWTGFPSAFESIFSTLFIPLSLAAFGIVLRGSGFAFRKVSMRTAEQRLNGIAFASSSVITPLCFGAIVAPNFRHQLTEPGQTLAFAGSLVQVAGLVLAVAGLPPALRHWTVRPEA